VERKFTFTAILIYFMLSKIRSFYSRFTPEVIRNSSLMKKAKGTLPHELMYDAEYFVHVEQYARQAAYSISASIMADLNPHSAIDVGCGTGALLEALRSRGCDVLGLEYAESALKYCLSRKLNVHKFDLERQSTNSDYRFDVAISTEVAEHLPESCADRYVDLLTTVAPQIVFTAATPGQGGRDHVNEQPASYWIEKFAARDFTFKEDLSQAWRRQWQQADIARWYWMNLMIFTKF
jgi:2-polyprenyl-3-methyl-5-hydroxy-6-metoxy-1,4-benzoquinol methylase